MLADRAWVYRNLGFDPIATPPPASTFTFTKAARPRSTLEDLRREIIDFDSEGPAGREFRFIRLERAPGLKKADMLIPIGVASQGS